MTNEQIAQDVMGWRREIKQTTGLVMDYVAWIDSSDNVLYSSLSSVRHDYLPDFLNDHNAAMMVVEKMREYHIYEVDEAPNGDYHVEFYPRDSVGDFMHTGSHKSLCHAICSAALKAKGHSS